MYVVCIEPNGEACANDSKDAIMWLLHLQCSYIYPERRGKAAGLCWHTVNINEMPQIENCNA